MANWFTLYRKTWIREMLEIYGFINREHLVKKFEISIPQASKDLSEMLRDHPSLIKYDLSRKAYVRAY